MFVCMCACVRVEGTRSFVVVVCEGKRRSGW